MGCSTKDCWRNTAYLDHILCIGCTCMAACRYLRLVETSRHDFLHDANDYEMYSNLYYNKNNRYWQLLLSFPIIRIMLHLLVCQIHTKYVKKPVCPVLQYIFIYSRVLFERSAYEIITYDSNLRIPLFKGACTYLLFPATIIIRDLNC